MLVLSDPLLSSVTQRPVTHSPELGVLLLICEPLLGSNCVLPEAASWGLMNYAMEKGQEPGSQAALGARQLFHQHLGEVG